MNESRVATRTNVTWRGAIQVIPGKIVPAKIINFSSSGIQIQCSAVLKEKQTYQIMMEVPSTHDASKRTQVVCKATCVYSILSGNEYRTGMKYFEVQEQHMALLTSWHG
ncbi:PilZ domain-containing protein [Undibacterium sp. Di27W]|uniref:PilZ domain-containing protein n=1 Tax=Undibacterium sp. Di27W TaxID=3413036 RepID=UPI003BF19436